MRALRAATIPLLALAAACGSDADQSGNGGPSRDDVADGSGTEDVAVLDTGETSDTAAADAADTGAPDTVVDTGPVSCDPLSLRCDGPRGRVQCNAAGDGWDPIVGCDDPDVCLNGLCVSPCEVPGKFEGSTVGCQFWSVDLGQWHVNEGEIGLDPSVSVIPHAVLIGNPSERPTTVTFTVTDGTPVDVDDPVVPPGEARSFLMPVLSQQQTGVTSQAIHVVSTQPVIASQFNPASNAPGFALHSTDASLLYPTDMLGTYYVGISQYGVEGFMGSPGSLAYLTVVAVEDGTTTVNVSVTAATMAGGDIPAHDAGDRFTVTLERGQILNLNAVPRPLMSGTGGDLTGSVITSDKPIAAFTGHQCMVIVEGNCDHLEGQLLPVERWGTRYLAVPFQTPNPVSVYRVVAAQDGTVLHTSPAIAGLESVTLDAGEWAEATTPQAFEITGSQPFSVAQFMAGNLEGGSYLVDTSMTVLVPSSEYRRNYPLLIPEDFPVDHLSIARPIGIEVTLNGEPIDASFSAVGSSGYEVGYVVVDDGVQLLESEAPFGVVSYGYGQKVSYALPGGMGGEE